ncbi:MAG: choice-of-anchor Q domain-containing protein, partial [Verrucomicrobiota bacterium]
NFAAAGQGGLGGGINASGGNLIIVNSTFNANKAHLGGALYNSGAQVAISNSTFSANEATAGPDSAGAAIYNSSTLSIQSCTIASNIITSGMGFGAGIRNVGTATIRSSIVAGNTAPTNSDLSGIFISGGYNLIGVSNGATNLTNGVNNDLVGTNALLGPLQNNGGPTATMALLGGSPAIDKGSGGGLTTDQRGQPRPFDQLTIVNASGGDGSDIGAYEVSLLVVNTNDSGAGSLRQAILDNNASTGGNTIGFANNVIGKITLLTGELLVTKNLGVVGPGNKILTLSGNNVSRIFHFTNNAVASISGLTLVEGRGAPGGAILQDSGSLTLTLSSITNNFSNLQGGGIAAAGAVSLTQCTLSYNRGTNDGGAIFQTNGNLTIDACTLNNNFSSIRGGAVTVNPAATASFHNSTFYSNNATFGGAAILYSTVAITNCTFTGNSAVFGGGIHNFDTSFTTVRNSILSGNSASSSGRDSYGPVITQSYNLVGTTNGSSGWSATVDQIGTTNAPLDALLGPLGDNGGPTWTVALLSGSPAIDKGKIAFNGAVTDQRGAPRPYDFPLINNATGGDGADVGAFELGVPTLNLQRAAGNNILLSWPSYYGDFALESMTNLNLSIWTPIGGAIVVGNQYNVTNDTAGEQKYFRLHSQ